MKKSILKLGEKLNREEQRLIHGGNFELSSCFSIQDQDTCDNRNDCNWYGCYCGPLYPHFALCS